MDLSQDTEAFGFFANQTNDPSDLNFQFSYYFTDLSGNFIDLSVV